MSGMSDKCHARYGKFPLNFCSRTCSKTFLYDNDNIVSHIVRKMD